MEPLYAILWIIVKIVVGLFFIFGIIVTILTILLWRENNLFKREDKR